MLLAYLVFIVGLLIRNYIQAGTHGREAYGLNVLLFGLLAGMLPAVIASLARSLPGSTYYFLTMALIPLALVYAVEKAAASRDDDERSPEAPREPVLQAT